MHFALKGYAVIEFLKDHTGDIHAAQNTVLFREYDPERLFTAGYDRFGGDIATADIFFQGLPYDPAESFLFLISSNTFYNASLWCSPVCA